MITNIGIHESSAQTVAATLSKLLADEVVLYMKTRNAHWNVTGVDFHAKHKFFEEQYEALDEIMDSVAERIRSIGHFAPATLKTYLELTHLTEANRADNNSVGHIKELLADHENIIMFIRENVNPFAELKDFGSSDFITGLMETHEKMAWMLRAHL